MIVTARPWSRRSSYFLQWSQDNCFKSDLIALLKVCLHCRSSHQRCSVRKGALSNIANSQEGTCVRVSFLIKLQLQACNFIEKRLWHRCFPVSFAKVLRIPFLQNTSGRLLLALDVKKVKRAIFVLKIYQFRRDQVNLLVYGPDRPYFNQKQKYIYIYIYYFFFF